MLQNNFPVFVLTVGVFILSAIFQPFSSVCASPLAGHSVYPDDLTDLTAILDIITRQENKHLPDIPLLPEEDKTGIFEAVLVLHVLAGQNEPSPYSIDEGQFSAFPSMITESGAVLGGGATWLKDNCLEEADGNERPTAGSWEEDHITVNPPIICSSPGHVTKKPLKQRKKK